MEGRKKKILLISNIFENQRDQEKYLVLNAKRKNKGK